MEQERYCYTCDAINSHAGWQQEGVAEESFALCKWCGCPTDRYPTENSEKEAVAAECGGPDTDDETLLQDQLRDLQTKAESGDAKAQFRLAMQFDGDDSRVVNDRIRWLEAAAQQGHARACMERCLIELEWSGDGELARSWYRRGRQLGHPHDLSFLEYYGMDWKDWAVLGPGAPTKAELIEHAEAGDSGAQFMMSECYAAGEHGFPFDLIRSFAWCATSHLPPSSMEGHIKIRNLEELRSYLTQASNTLRILDSVFDDEERAQAFALVEKFSPFRQRQPRKG
jgi:hypothetical protein